MNVSCFKSLICDNLLYQLHKTNRPSITQHILLELLFSCQVASHSLQPHGLQHARLPCPSLSPGVCPSSRVLNQWCHPTISSSDTLFSCPQPFPASVSFPMSQLFTSSGQSTRASASPSFLPMSIQGWLPLRLIGLIYCCPRDSQESSPAPQSEGINCLAFCLLYSPALTTFYSHYRIC